MQLSLSITVFSSFFRIFIFILMVFVYMTLPSEALHRFTTLNNVAVLAESASLKCFISLVTQRDPGLFQQLIDVHKVTCSAVTVSL